VYMMHPNTKELKMVRVNRSQLLKDPQTCEDLLAGALIRRSIDLPSPNDVSLSVLVLSQCGTEVNELDISYKYDSTLLKYAELS
jgi:hypothetical protein